MQVPIEDFPMLEGVGGRQALSMSGVGCLYTDLSAYIRQLEPQRPEDSPMSTVFESARHRFSRHEFSRMVDAGIFGPDDHVELLDGEILDMSPQKSRHATAVTLAGDALRAIFDRDATVRLQLPLSLDEHSEPEPDIAVVPGHPRDYRDAHPSTALLICEVSDSTLAYDRGKKRSSYARAGIPEYWILDLNAGRLEIYREPEGEDYAIARLAQPDDSIEPLLREGRMVFLRDLLP